LAAKVHQSRACLVRLGDTKGQRSVRRVMIARYRPGRALQESPAPAPARKPKAKRMPVRPKRKPKPAPKPKSVFDFALLERQILLRPPLRHRGEPPEGGLSVFEFCLGVAAVILAKRSFGAAAYRDGQRAGKRAMTANRNSEQPIHDKASLSPGEQFEAIGSAGFERGFARFYKDHAGQNWPIEASRAELLRCADLDRKGGNSRRVSGALNRLTLPVRNFPPVLSRWGSDGERLKLIVRHEWLQLPRYGRVLLPLPKSGPVVLALYLFLIAITPRRATITNPRPRRATSATSIAAQILYERLGIRTGGPAHNERALRNALALVNDHRRKLGQPSFELLGVGEGAWRFSHTRHPSEKSKATPKRRVKLKSGAAEAWGSMPKSIRERGWIVDDEPGPDDDEIEDELEHQEREDWWYEKNAHRASAGDN
jgi:hypothetical protein